jgi:cyclopropane-fatty-acyl-phospholipid synthase
MNQSSRHAGAVANLKVSSETERKSASGWLIALARKLVLSQLDKIHTGALVLKEGDQVHCFGNAQADEAADHGDGLRAELVVHDAGCYRDILTGGSIGAAEAYMTGDWSTPDLTRLVRVLVRNIDVVDGMEGGLARLSAPVLKWFHSMNRNSEKGARRNIAAHYDLGNDFFELFLDPTMMYSAGIFPSAHASMEEASLNKLKIICDKLGLTESDHLLEIGTGWGALAIYAAKHYGCRVTTTTISEEQYALAAKRIEQEGLSDQIQLLKQDYRDLTGQYDKLVSVEMIEAVGWKYYPTFFKTCASLLKPDGKMLIQAITILDQRYESARKSVDFIQRYIFPGSCIPSIHALNSAAMDVSDFRLIDLEDFAEHYARTLNAWQRKFLMNLSEVRKLGYSEEFIRMWQFYLSYCEGGFSERQIGVSHLVYAKPLFRE